MILLRSSMQAGSLRSNFEVNFAFMKPYLVDGTYELFRHYYALPHHANAQREEVAATRGVLFSMLSLVADGATHIAVATDHVIESFRNALWNDYKDSSGIAPDLYSQFGLLEDALRAFGFLVWPMVEYEADDALAAGAKLCRADNRVEQVLICTPDKDLAQCVIGDRVVQMDRRRKAILDADGVVKKFGVQPESIPDYLALVGDAADGYPGLPGWGARSAAAVLARFRHLEQIPRSALDWHVNARGATLLAKVLSEQFERVLLFRRLATLVDDGPVTNTVDDLKWRGPLPDFRAICSRLDAPQLAERAESLATRIDK